MAGDLDFGAIDFGNADYGDGSIFSSETLITGDNTYNTMPVITNPGQSADDGGFWGSTQNVLGSIGSVISNAPKIGTALGTAVGTAEHNISQAGTNYNNAHAAAASGNNLGTWWQYASTTDKMMIGLAVIGIFVALKD